MSDWTLRYSRQAQKDARRLAASNLKNRAQRLLDIIADDPFTRPPAYERLVGDLAGYYSRRINIQHQLVYEVHPEERVILILRMWTHYEQMMRMDRRGASPAPDRLGSQLGSWGSRTTSTF